jgi:hypothetical protein
MADTFKGIITADGKKRQLPYGSVLDKPASDETLSIQGAFADAKAVGDKFKTVKAETDSLKEDIIGLESELIETVHGKNLLDISKCTANSYINSDTGIIEHDDRRKGYVTDLIPVKEGYKLVSSYYLNKVTHPYDMLSIAHYNANKNFIPLFTTNIDTYKIPSGVAYVRCTIHKNLINYNGQLELNKDGIATTYAPYVEPFVKLPKKIIDNSNLVTHDELNENESKTVVAKGFNMIEVCETGIGAYHASGGDIKFEPSYTAYAYIIANVKKNTRYIYIKRLVDLLDGQSWLMKKTI